MPPLLLLGSIEEYKNHFEVTLCRREIVTFDGIRVYFNKHKFEHCFYESSDRRGAKDVFSHDRAQRMDWIEKTMINQNCIRYQGWDKDKKIYRPDRCVSLVYEDFVVVIGIGITKTKVIKADFITCYKADNSINKITKSPNWDINICKKLLGI